MAGPSGITIGTFNWGVAVRADAAQVLARQMQAVEQQLTRQFALKLQVKLDDTALRNFKPPAIPPVTLALRAQVSVDQVRQQADELRKAAQATRDLYQAGEIGAGEAKARLEAYRAALRNLRDDTARLGPLTLEQTRAIASGLASVERTVAGVEGRFARLSIGENFSRALSAGLAGVNPQLANLTVLLSQAGTAAQAGGARLLGLAAGGAAAGGALAGAATAAAVFARNTVDLEEAVNDAAITLEAAGDQQQRLAELAKDVGVELRTSSVQVARAFEELGTQGATLEDIFNGAGKATVQLARATKTELTTAAAIAGQAAAVYRDSGISFDQLADVVTNAANKTSLTVRDFNEALGQGSRAIKLINLDLPTFAALVATIRPSATGASDAATALSNAVQRLVAPTDTGAAALKRLGVSAFDAQGQTRPFLEVLGDLERGLRGLSEQEKLDLLVTVFGADGAKGVLPLLNQGAEALARLRDNLGQAGSAAEAAAKRFDTVKGANERLLAAFNNFLTSPSTNGVLNFWRDLNNAVAQYFERAARPTPRQAVNLRESALGVKFTDEEKKAIEQMEARRRQINDSIGQMRTDIQRAIADFGEGSTEVQIGRANLQKVENELRDIEAQIRKIEAAAQDRKKAAQPKPQPTPAPDATPKPTAPQAPTNEAILAEARRIAKAVVSLQEETDARRIASVKRVEEAFRKAGKAQEEALEAAILAERNRQQKSEEARREAERRAREAERRQLETEQKAFEKALPQASEEQLRRRLELEKRIAESEKTGEERRKFALRRIEQIEEEFERRAEQRARKQQKAEEEAARLQAERVKDAFKTSVESATDLEGLRLLARRLEAEKEAATTLEARREAAERLAIVQRRVNDLEREAQKIQDATTDGLAELNAQQAARVQAERDRLARQEAVNKALEEYRQGVAEAEELGRLFGNEAEVNSRKLSLLEQTISRLIRLGLSPQSAIVQQLISDYEKLARAADEAAQKLQKRDERQFFGAEAPTPEESARGELALFGLRPELFDQERLEGLKQRLLELKLGAEALRLFEVRPQVYGLEDLIALRELLEEIGADAGAVQERIDLLTGAASPQAQRAQQEAATPTGGANAPELAPLEAFINALSDVGGDLSADELFNRFDIGEFSSEQLQYILDLIDGVEGLEEVYARVSAALQVQIEDLVRSSQEGAEEFAGSTEDLSDSARSVALAAERMKAVGGLEEAFRRGVIGADELKEGLYEAYNALLGLLALVEGEDAVALLGFLEQLAEKINVLNFQGGEDGNKKQINELDQQLLDLGLDFAQTVGEAFALALLNKGEEALKKLGSGVQSILNSLGNAVVQQQSAAFAAKLASGGLSAAFGALNPLALLLGLVGIPLLGGLLDRLFGGGAEEEQRRQEAERQRLGSSIPQITIEQNNSVIINAGSPVEDPRFEQTVRRISREVFESGSDALIRTVQGILPKGVVPEGAM